MAPSQEKRADLRVKAKAARPWERLIFQTSTSDASLFPSSKKDKRAIKHSAFVNKIERASSKSKKRRRPNKKLFATLESLADALPEMDNGQDQNKSVVGQARVHHKSLKSRPGAMKRKEKLEKTERERFGMNLAQMVGSTQAQAYGSNNSAVGSRWAALKTFVQSTAEKKAEFATT
ncbi:uncharacterized protein K441DRAFT_622287 [Cenococcum geophilum 1.58]|uniref:Uncharacterized protein n=1 Tax=Cenococcum geophilum 1.58 TaxID=794803 RepID=A0ACC8EN90_9PEZI|nr:hypothetical protein K441DRAFT_622287 [Cenococcum geophilum 1.58]